MMRSAFIAVSAALAMLLSSCRTTQPPEETGTVTPAQRLEMEDTYVPWWAKGTH